MKKPIVVELESQDFGFVVYPEYLS